MRLRVIAVGTRMPEWVDAGFNDYARRLRTPYTLELRELATATRSGSSAGAARQAMAEEAKRILVALGARSYVVALDERGASPTTLKLARWLDDRRGAGQDLDFIIGGPDGLADEVLQRADYRWSLSPLTLPHGLVRVFLAEQLYRAASVLDNHPYHRQ
ncbi:MAG: 23S rRNA (pseudouridine(1915)-N(3))-methyltransferase RlmH [Steroidobacteraceae bacterium]